MGGRPPALDKQTGTGTRPAPAPARGRPRVAEEFPHRRNCPHRRSRRRAGLSPYEPRNPAPGARPTTEAAHRAARGRASTGAPISTSPTKRSWAGAGPHWGRQRTIGVGKLPAPVGGSPPRCEFPTPMRVSYPDASLLPRCESPTPMRVSCPDTARRIRKGPAAGNRSARRTPRTRAHSPGPLGISARSAASRSGTS